MRPLGADAPAGAPGQETPLEEAVLRGVLYASLFRCALRLDELHRALPGVEASPAEVEAALRSPRVAARVERLEGFVVPRGRREWIPLRAERLERTVRLLQAHSAAVGRIARLPWVRLVALSGACAHGNAEDEDVDLFIVTRRGRAWAVALAIQVLTKAWGLRRSLCVNYLVDEDALALPEDDLFTSSEIVGLRPLFGHDAYRAFVAANPAVRAAFPNFAARHAADAGRAPEAPAGPLERRLDACGLGILAERLARLVLGRRLRRTTAGCPGVVLEPGRLKLHTTDHRPGLLRRYEEALREAGLGVRPS